jgi:hypothetical protein
VGIPGEVYADNHALQPASTRYQHLKVLQYPPRLCTTLNQVSYLLSCQLREAGNWRCIRGRLTYCPLPCKAHPTLCTPSTTKIIDEKLLTCTQMRQSISMAFAVANCEPYRIRPNPCPCPLPTRGPGPTLFSAFIYALRTRNDHSLSWNVLTRIDFGPKCSHHLQETMTTMTTTISLHISSR